MTPHFNTRKHPIMRALIVCGTLALAAGAAQAAGLTPADESDARTLEANVRAIHKEMVQLTTDLQQLQRELLTPSSTRVTVFLSVDNQAGYAPDSVQLLLDNQVVQNWLYTADEQNALKRSGVQQLYVGNLPVGEHKLAAVVLSPDGGAKGDVTYNITKELGPKYVELKIGGSSKQPAVKVKEWD